MEAFNDHAQDAFGMTSDWSEVHVSTIGNLIGSCFTSLQLLKTQIYLKNYVSLSNYFQAVLVRLTSAL